VDDESAIAEMAEMVLTEYGFEVTVTTRPDEALRLIVEGPESFDVLVTDMTMPGMLGTHLARRARELRPGLPVLLYTGFSESVSGETLREAGIGRLLMKPVAPLDLARAINEVLEER
jgi:CheY-like chemotaxis protein